MSRLNTKPKSAPIYTHEGGRAQRDKPLDQLLRSVMSCLLWEGEFYEEGEEIADRIGKLVKVVQPQDVAAMAVRARTQFKLRHVPLLLLAHLAKTAKGTGVLRHAVPQVVRRADELGELLSIYWKLNGPEAPISKQLKAGLADAVKNFGEYQLAKYDRDSAVKLRDVIFLTHAKPKDKEQAKVFAKLVNRTFYPKTTGGGFKLSTLRLKGEPKLETPDTWETNLSGGKDKRETFERLLREEKLGYLALLRNLRNMVESGVDRNLITDAIRARKGADMVLPFRFVAAVRAAPTMLRVLDEALLKSIENLTPMQGHTVVMVDVSGSMDDKLSAKSDMTRADAAAALAAMVPGDVTVYSFSDRLVSVPVARGLSGIEQILRSQAHSGTQLAAAINAVNRSTKYDRIIVITDEQATGYYGAAIPKPTGRHAYMINVASAKNGVARGKEWQRIDGFSEAIFTYIAATEDR